MRRVRISATPPSPPQLCGSAPNESNQALGFSGLLGTLSAQ
jgi:hypothetical protein